MWGCGVLPATLPAPFSATLSPALSIYLCANVGPQGLLVVGLPAPFIPHSASLGLATAIRVLSAPVPVSAPPTGLDEGLFFISLVSDFLAVGFSVSSGCARRRSVSTYAAILVLPHHLSYFPLTSLAVPAKFLFPDQLLPLKSLPIQSSLCSRHFSPFIFVSCLVCLMYLYFFNSQSNFQ